MTSGWFGICTCPTVCNMVIEDNFLRSTITWIDHEAAYSQPSREKIMQGALLSLPHVYLNVVVFKYHENLHKNVMHKNNYHCCTVTLNKNCNI